MQKENYKAGYRDHTNSLFLRSEILKFADLEELQTTQIMLKAKNYQLTGNFRKMFTERQESYNLREFLNFRTVSVRTTLYFCL